MDTAVPQSITRARDPAHLKGYGVGYQGACLRKGPGGPSLRQRRAAKGLRSKGTVKGALSNRPSISAYEITKLAINYLVSKILLLCRVLRLDQFDG